MNPSPRRRPSRFARVRIALASLAALGLGSVTLLLTSGPAAARGGGGSGGFGGGGGGYHGSSYHGSGYHGGGSLGAGGTVLVIVVLVIAVGIALAAQAAKKGSSRSNLNTTSDREAHRSDGQAQARAHDVEAQVDNLAVTDATFDVEALENRAMSLYRTAQRAWTANDQETLQGILAPALFGKWSEELDDYASRGEVNVVEIVSGPTVQMVNVANREGETNDTVTFRISATLDDYVTQAHGARKQRLDGSSRPVEYWTLRKREDGEWIVTSIEQAQDGAHHLTDEVETDTWNQKSVAREATLESAAATSPALGRDDVLDMTNISWAEEADEAARDLSLIDARFDDSVLEVAIAEFVEQWQLNDGSLDFTSVRTPHRTVLRSAEITDVEVRDLVSREPITFHVAVTTHGVYYEVDRRTENVLVGDAHQVSDVRFVFTMRLDDVAARSWTVTEAQRDQATPAR